MLTGHYLMLAGLLPMLTGHCHMLAGLLHMPETSQDRKPSINCMEKELVLFLIDLF